MKKLIFSAVFLFAGFVVVAQQDAQFTQNMFNKLSVNPGSAGSNGGICATILHRTQWTGFEGHPQTTLFSADALIANRHGIGLTAFQDKLGIESNFEAKLAYSYNIFNVGPGTLGIGLEVGIINKSFGDNFIALDDYTQDPSIPNANTSAMSFDAGVGLFYNIKDQMYVGISSLHLPQSKLTQDANAGDTTTGESGLEFLRARHYYIQAGYNWRIGGNPMRELKPSIFVKTDAASTQLDFNILYEHNKLVWIGVSYRIEDAIAGLVGVRIPSGPLTGLKIGFSYDYTTSALNNYSNGSLEFMVNYCTTLNPTPPREVYRSVRFL